MSHSTVEKYKLPLYLHSPLTKGAILHLEEELRLLIVQLTTLQSSSKLKHWMDEHSKYILLIKELKITITVKKKELVLYHVIIPAGFSNLIFLDSYVEND